MQEQTVTNMKAMYESGFSQAEIARKFNKDGDFMPNGKEWSQDTVSRAVNDKPLPTTRRFSQTRRTRKKTTKFKPQAETKEIQATSRNKGNSSHKPKQRNFLARSSGNQPSRLESKNQSYDRVDGLKR